MVYGSGFRVFGKGSEVADAVYDAGLKVREQKFRVWV
jgi:hypothetical protein